jgi:hypothetical protein
MNTHEAIGILRVTPMTALTLLLSAFHGLVGCERHAIFQIRDQNNYSKESPEVHAPSRSEATTTP